MDTSINGFYAYKEFNNAGAGAAGLIGGAIGVGVYAAITIDHAKKKRYTIVLTFRTVSLT